MDELEQKSWEIIELMEENKRMKQKLARYESAEVVGVIPEGKECGIILRYLETGHELDDQDIKTCKYLHRCHWDSEIKQLGAYCIMNVLSRERCETVVEEGKGYKIERVQKHPKCLALTQHKPHRIIIVPEGEE